MNNLISYLLIVLGILILTEPLKSINANTDEENIQEQIANPKRLNINVAIDSPEDIKVNEGDEIKKGQIIATRDKTKNQLLSQREQLLSSLNKVKALKPIPPTAPLEVPPLSILPPISYLEYEAEIEKKKIDIDFINDEIRVKNEEIDYLSQLKELDEKVINHEKAKLNKLRQKLTGAQALLQAVRFQGISISKR